MPAARERARRAPLRPQAGQGPTPRVPSHEGARRTARHPALPGRHDRVHVGSLPFRMPFDVPVYTTANVSALTRTPATATASATTPPRRCVQCRNLRRLTGVDAPRSSTS